MNPKAVRGSDFFVIKNGRDKPINDTHVNFTRSTAKYKQNRLLIDMPNTLAKKMRPY